MPQATYIELWHCNHHSAVYKPKLHKKFNYLFFIGCRQISHSDPRILKSCASLQRKNTEPKFGVGTISSRADAYQLVYSFDFKKLPDLKGTKDKGKES